MHCPIAKTPVPKVKPRIIECTMGVLTEKEREEICRQIKEGWVCGLIKFGETYNLQFNLIVNRKQL